MSTQDTGARRAALSDTKRALLEARLRGAAPAAAARPEGVTRCAGPGPEFPASFAQERMWFLSRFAPGSPMYNIPVGMLVPADVDVPALERALTAVVRRHETLRTTYRMGADGQLVQVVQPAHPIRIEVIDVRDQIGEAGGSPPLPEERGGRGPGRGAPAEAVRCLSKRREERLVPLAGRLPDVRVEPQVPPPPLRALVALQPNPPAHLRPVRVHGMGAAADGPVVVRLPLLRARGGPGHHVPRRLPLHGNAHVLPIPGEETSTRPIPSAIGGGSATLFFGSPLIHRPSAVARARRHPQRESHAGEGRVRSGGTWLSCGVPPHPDGAGAMGIILFSIPSSSCSSRWRGWEGQFTLHGGSPARDGRSFDRRLRWLRGTAARRLPPKDVVAMVEHEAGLATDHLPLSRGAREGAPGGRQDAGLPDSDPAHTNAASCPPPRPPSPEIFPPPPVDTGARFVYRTCLSRPRRSASGMVPEAEFSFGTPEPAGARPAQARASGARKAR